MHRAVRNAIAELEAGSQELNLSIREIGDAGAEVLATALTTNTTLNELKLYSTRIGPVGERGRLRRPSTTTRRSRPWTSG
jgi:hypothetical protein